MKLYWDTDGPILSNGGNAEYGIGFSLFYKKSPSQLKIYFKSRIYKWSVVLHKTSLDENNKWFHIGLTLAKVNT